MVKVEHTNSPSTPDRREGGSHWIINGGSSTDTTNTVYINSFNCTTCDKHVLRTEKNKTWYNKKGYCNECGIDILGIKVGTIELVI